MVKIRDFLKEELTGWHRWEVLWLLFACAVITGLTVCWQDSVMGIISATTGVACVVCTGKGKLSAYIFGTVNDRMADYLEMGAETGVNNTCFICMMPANEYCRKHHVDPERFHLEKDPRFRVWNHFHDYDYCSCSTGDYLGRQRAVRFYYRVPGKHRAPYARQLVYDADNRLLDGFGGTEIMFASKPLKA